MNRDFRQVTWDDQLEAEWLELVRLAVREDLGTAGDLTTLALVPPQSTGRAAVVARQPGAIAGLRGAAALLGEVDSRLAWEPLSEDGDSVQPGDCVATIGGPTAGILAAERVLLNLLGRLSGIATLTRRFAEAVEGTGARLYDTRKTTPGWRRLEKYAVRCGGGWNHRTGLFDAVLIKDNHLAAGATAGDQARFSPAQAVQQAREYLRRRAAEDPAAGKGDRSNLPGHQPEVGRGPEGASYKLDLPPFPARDPIVEVEVDTLEQLEEVLPAGPDIVLMDNMTPDQLRRAVAIRDRIAPAVELEASGGVRLETVRAIAETGVERISVGALTHSAAGLDLGLDWAGGAERGA